LEFDPENIKALYRRAEARVRPSSATAYDHDCAIKDLNKASQIDPDDKIVSSLLKTLREDRKKQREKDKGTFEGMFDRGEIYDEESMAKAEEEKAASHTNHRWEGVPNDNEMRDLRKRIEDVNDDDPLEKRIADAELLRDLYERNDKEEEAQKLNDQIQNAKRALAEQRAKKATPDFSNPTPEMIADAQKYGLDLSDPLVQAELQRIEKEGPEALDQMDAEGDSPPPPPALEMPLPDIPEYVAIPWMRYVALIGVIILLLRFWDVFVLLRRVIAFLSRLLRPQDDGASFAEAQGASMFERAYKLLFATSGDDTEL
jgi:hypothetical protein